MYPFFKKYFLTPTPEIITTFSIPSSSWVILSASFNERKTIINSVSLSKDQFKDLLKDITL